MPLQQKLFRLLLNNVTRITSSLLGRSHYTKYRIPPVYNTHTHTVLYIYIYIPDGKHHPKEAPAMP